MTRPVIGYVTAPKGDTLLSLLVGAVIRLSGGNPLRLRREPASGQRQCDGLILMGGLDIHPSRYDASIEVESRFDPERDALETDPTVPSATPFSESGSPSPERVFSRTLSRPMTASRSIVCIAGRCVQSRRVFMLSLAASVAASKPFSPIRRLCAWACSSTLSFWFTGAICGVCSGLL